MLQRFRQGSKQHAQSRDAANVILCRRVRRHQAEVVLGAQGSNPGPDGRFTEDCRHVGNAGLLLEAI